MRELLAAALLALCLGCAPHSIIPAVGTSLVWEMCGQTSQGVLIARGPNARCPDMKRIDERARRVKAAFRGCALDGVKVHVANAYVMCGEEQVRGCTTGSLITVTDEALVMSTIEHEFAHVCISQLHGVDSLAHYRLDHPDLYQAEKPPRFTR